MCIRDSLHDIRKAHENEMESAPDTTPADYEVPAALLNSDEQLARLIEEADKYVGFPYVRCV